MRALAPLAAGLLLVLIPYSLPADEPGKESAGEWVITGTVVDESGDPVSGAAVAPIRVTELAPATTKEDGSFRVAIPKTEKRAQRGQIYFDLRATKGNLLGAERLLGRVGELKPVEITLKPAHEIIVRVTDATGEPVPGADVRIMNSFMPAGSGKTDAEGRWAGLVSTDAKQWSVFARKSGAGFNYATSQVGPRGDQEHKPLPEETSLTLSGPYTLRVKTVDASGKPLADVSVSPWLIQTAGQEHQINLSGSTGLQSETGPDGIVVLDWLPSDFQSFSITARLEDYYALDHATFISADDPVHEMTITLYPQETLSGRVTHADGSPAEGIGVVARGQGVGMNNGRGATVTDADGRYEMRVNSKQAYIVRVADDEWGAAYQAPVVVRAGKPVTDIDFSLVPATKLHGRVTAGTNNAPVENASIYAHISLGEIPEELQELAPADSNRYYSLSDQLYMSTEEDGSYAFTLGPGKYLLRYPGGHARGKEIEVTVPENDPPAEIETNFHLDRPLEGPLTVAVVDQKGRPVPHAMLLSRYRALVLRNTWYQPVETDEEGRLETDRSLEKLVIHGTSPDGKLKGITRLDATAAHAKVVLGPTTSATGILLSEDGDIAANKELKYGIRIFIGEDGPYGPFSDSFGGSATTDAKGRFTIDGLIPGESYEVSISTGEHSSRTVTTIKVPGTETHDLGKVEVDTQPYQPYVPPTAAERSADYFDASPDITVAERLETVLGNARRMYTRPLVLMGCADDSAAIELFRRFYGQSDGAEGEPSASDLRWEFELIALDSSREDVAKYAKEHGIPIGKNASPRLLALDEQGEIIARLPLHLEREPVLAPKPRMSEAQQNNHATRENALLSFLMEHKLPTRDAETMLDEAFATAAAEDKNVFLICSASWCGPCRMLAKFLDPHHEKLDEHYVFVHLDVSRDTHAQEINKKYKGERSGGVPWYVILDPEGNELISSNMPAEDDQAENKEEPKYKTNGPNMGNPGSPEGIDHFLNMLAATAPDMDPKLLEKMREELEEE